MDSNQNSKVFSEQSFKNFIIKIFRKIHMRKKKWVNLKEEKNNFKDGNLIYHIQKYVKLR